MFTGRAKPIRTTSVRISGVLLYIIIIIIIIIIKEVKDAKI